MSRSETLTVYSLLGLLSANGLYMLLYAWLFGMSLWITFFGGVIAYKALPRQQFGILQHRTFPVYFVTSTVLSSSLVALWTLSHPDVITNIYHPHVANVAQVYALASVMIGQSANYFIIGPLTSRYVFHF